MCLSQLSMRVLFLLLGFLFSITGNAQIQVSNQDRVSIGLNVDYGIRHMRDDNTLIVTNNAEIDYEALDQIDYGIYIKKQGQPISQVAVGYSESCCGVGPILTTGDYIVAQQGYSFARYRISDPLQRDKLVSPPGYEVVDDTHVRGVAEDGCAYGYTYVDPYESDDESRRAIIWCEGEEPRVLDHASWISSLDAHSGLAGIFVPGGEDDQSGAFYAESMLDGTSTRLTFGDSSEGVREIKSTAFNEDRPGAFTALMQDGNKLILKVWNNDREPDPVSWSGETIEVDDMGSTGRLVAFTDRFVVYVKESKCRVFSAGRVSQVILGRYGAPFRLCRDATETGNVLNVMLWSGSSAAKITYPIRRAGDIADLSESNLAGMHDFLRTCNHRRLERRAEYERQERNVGRLWREIAFPLNTNSCRQRAATKYRVDKTQLRRHHNQMMYAGVGGDDSAWVDSIPASMREAVGALESCVGTFASTDKRLAWRCAKQIGKSTDSAIGALDAYALFEAMSKNGYPKSY